MVDLSSFNHSVTSTCDSLIQMLAIEVPSAAFR